jgi:AraC-like DNA-binding protein/mannose-6-phosphate isomerase-like protein (cupin superfamily)
MNISHETVVHPSASLRCLRLALDAFRGPHHRHRHFELTWVEKGSGLRSVGDSVMPFSDGDMVLLGPNLPHRWATLQRAAPGRAVATVVQFEPELLDGSLLPELRTAHLALAGATRGLAVAGATHGAVTRLLTTMQGADAISQLAALVELLGQLSRGRRDLQPLATLAAPPLVAGEPLRRDEVLDWIHRHIAHEMVADDAARLVHVTVGAFSRWFKREIGRTFTDYVNDARCSAACDRLLRTDVSVARLADQCGFTTLSNFNAQFKRRYGRTPREFRRAR